MVCTYNGTTAERMLYDRIAEQKSNDEQQNTASDVSRRLT